ncbi:sigma-70 family RNA polymerase sigma factor [Pedobacter sp. MW01-1-1]|uniref:sigma-70 family RNA polymerase sigma factor n=1 Tax=Pedobacter sp. MW01-1-1 TaxID=3383027 RepID=UPI003FEF0F79
MEYIAELSSGCLHTFQKVYGLHNQKLYAYVLKKTNSAFIAEEVVQLTFIRLWEKRKNLSTGYTLSAQLFQMAGSILIDQIRKNAINEKHLSIVEAESTHAVNDSTEYDLLHRAIERMAPMRKRVFNLSKREGYSYKEIAELLSISPKTVETHISKALKELRAAFSSIISLVVVFWLS